MILGNRIDGVRCWYALDLRLHSSREPSEPGVAGPERAEPECIANLQSATSNRAHHPVQQCSAYCQSALHTPATSAYTFSETGRLRRDSKAVSFFVRAKACSAASPVNNHSFAPESIRKRIAIWRTRHWTSAPQSQARHLAVFLGSRRCKGKT